MILLTIQPASATTISGIIYDYQLNELNDAIIDISGDTTQKILAESSTYSFELAKGDYILKARWADLEAVESISIQEDDIIYDLFLFPSFADEDDLWDDLDPNTADIEIDPKYGLSIDLIVLLAFIGIGLFVLLRTKVFKDEKKKEEPKVEEPKKEKKVESEEEKADLVKESEPKTKEESDDVLSKRVLTFLKTNEGRVSQKQLRKELMDISEAKVSLVLTDLVHKGKIEKIKKGRGNVIILK